MLNLYKIGIKKALPAEGLSDAERLSISYHNLFDYPMSFSDLFRWSIDVRLLADNWRLNEAEEKGGFLYARGRSGLLYKRELRKRISERKMEIAKRASKILSLVPTIKMVGITGSLAMANSTDDSDIDLIVITKSGTLWITRLLAYAFLRLTGFRLRRPNDRHEQDKLCLNMWMDEKDLVWAKKDRNLYTAHEIAQVVPLVNKDRVYERFLWKNKWILNYWPRAVRIRAYSEKVMSQDSSLLSPLLAVLEKFSFNLQHHHMKSKITREVVTPTRALFHPQDWGSVVLRKLGAT